MATGPVFCAETTPSNFLLESRQTSQGVLPSVAIWSFIQEPISWHFWNHIKGTAVCEDCRGAAWENNVCHCNISLILPWPFAFIPLLRHCWIGVRGVVWEFEGDLNPIFVWTFATTQSATAYSSYRHWERGSELHRDFFDGLSGNEVESARPTVLSVTAPHTCWNAGAEP